MSDARRAGESYRFAHFANTRWIAARLDGSRNDLEDASLPRGQAVLIGRPIRERAHRTRTQLRGDVGRAGAAALPRGLRHRVLRGVVFHHDSDAKQMWLANQTSVRGVSRELGRIVSGLWCTFPHGDKVSNFGSNELGKRQFLRYKSNTRSIERTFEWRRKSHERCSCLETSCRGGDPDTGRANPPLPAARSGDRPGGSA